MRSVKQHNSYIQLITLINGNINFVADALKWYHYIYSVLKSTSRRREGCSIARCRATATWSSPPWGWRREGPTRWRTPRVWRREGPTRWRSAPSLLRHQQGSRGETPAHDAKSAMQLRRVHESYNLVGQQMKIMEPASDRKQSWCMTTAED